jgi:hypothetical protein
MPRIIRRIAQFPRRGVGAGGFSGHSAYAFAIRLASAHAARRNVD